MTKLKAWQYFLGLCLLLCTIHACKPYSADLVAPAPLTAQVQFNNLIPNQGAINLYVNGTRQNSSKLNYGDFSGYNSIGSGTQNISFETDSLHNQIYTAAIRLDTTFKTTLYVTGKTSAVAVIKTIDTAVADTKNIRPKLRFVQASADAPAMDLLVNNVTIANQAYKSVSAYSRVDTGKVTVQLRLAGTSTVVLSMPRTLSASGVYTIYAYGSYLGGANSITLGTR